jgi:hypothetical protein
MLPPEVAALWCCAIALVVVPVRADELDAATRGAVDAGLTWLSKRWDPDAPGAEARARNLKGMTAMALIALQLPEGRLVGLSAPAASAPSAPSAPPKP